MDRDVLSDLHIGLTTLGHILDRLDTALCRATLGPVLDRDRYVGSACAALDQAKGKLATLVQKVEAAA